MDGAQATHEQEHITTMAAPQTTTQPNRRETVDFPPNVPVSLSLKYSEPRLIAGRDGERAMFTTTDNRVLFLDPSVAGRITELGINVRESFTLTRKSTGKRGERDEWVVERTAGEQPNGTFAVPKLPDAAPAPKPPQRAAHAAGGTLVDEANALVDAYAVVLNRALTTYEGRIKPDEVRSILLSAYIQRRQLSSVA
jgi:hypothetical protein